MEGIGRGTTLGGRYVVDAPLGTNAGAGRWSAFDNDLGRDVTVLVLAHDDHRGPAVLDAARMAAGIAQMTLVRILDIGSDDHFVFVVEESLQRAPNLTDLVRDGGLPGDEVRRITGEVATGLETASQRGVHHLELTPDDVFRTVDGDVKVQGLGTSAALHSRADGGETAARVDAIAIVALAYAGLTGLAPEPALAGSLPLAPRVGAAVPPPSELAAGVPRDLDRLCDLTLVDHQGPLTPGDYARQIAPWSTRQINHDHAAGVAPAASTVPPGSAGPRPAALSASSGLTPGEDEPRSPSAVAASPEAATATGPRPGLRLGGGRPRAVALDPPAPLVPAEPLTRDESNLALANVAAFVVLSLVIGLYGLSRVGSHTDLGLGGATTNTSSSPSPSESAPGTESEAAPQQLAILSVEGFDPEGDQSENGNQAPRVFDGDPTTAWTTEGYNTAALGGLKTGVGLLVDLGPNRTARTIDINLLAACNLQVYVSPDRSLGSATLVGEQADANGQVSFPVPEGVSGQYIIVWLTSVARDSDGYYRGKVGEVVAYG